MAMRITLAVLIGVATVPAATWAAPEGAIEAAQPTSPATAATPAAAARPSGWNPGLPLSRPHHRGRIPMIVGWSVFGGTYLLTALLGVMLHNSTRICDDSGASCRRPGLPMLIPLVGPLFLIRDYAEIDSGPMVTASIMLFQSAGLAVGIAGTVMYVREARRRRAADAQAGFHLGRGVYLRPAPRLDGGTLQLSYRF